MTAAERNFLKFSLAKPIHARTNYERTDSAAPLSARNDRPLRAASLFKKCATSFSRADKADGFTNPILVSDDLEILAGHGRVAAAQLIGMTQAPIVRLSDLSPAQRKAYVLVDNKLALNAGWDRMSWPLSSRD